MLSDLTSVFYGHFFNLHFHLFFIHIIHLSGRVVGFVVACLIFGRGRALYDFICFELWIHYCMGDGNVVYLSSKCVVDCRRGI